jgi:hypothetical protein
MSARVRGPTFPEIGSPWVLLKLTTADSVAASNLPLAVTLELVAAAMRNFCSKNTSSPDIPMLRFLASGVLEADCTVEFLISAEAKSGMEYTKSMRRNTPKLDERLLITFPMQI